MNVHEQIKKHRIRLSLSQEELAEKIYVTRQTISNWENAKNYPDINSLILLGNVFEVSLDELVKGDLEEMKAQINQEDVKTMRRDSTIFAVLLIVTLVSLPFLYYELEHVGLVLWALLWGISIYFGWKLEKQKKVYDIQTYREVTSFLEGKTLDEIQKYKEIGKRPYQTFLYVIGSMIIGAVVVYGLCYLFYPR